MMNNPTGTRSVLVVEDNETTRMRVSELLRRHGYTVTEALDGLDALNKVSGQPFDAILLDLVMPNVDGWQFRATQMRHPELAAIPAVVVTVHPLREHERYALRAADIIHKPFEDDALLRAVERACGQSRPSRIAAHPESHSASLFWSRKGEIACGLHAPEPASDRWREEAWAAIPSGAGKGRVTYQCQHCDERGTPIAHSRREWALPSDEEGETP
jgi:CheY-like chemotaxis protein